MASCSFPDIYSWLQNLPSLHHWHTDSISICICSSSSSQPSLTFTACPKSQPIFSIFANFTFPISLWTSNPLKLNSKSPTFLDQDAINSLLTNFIKDILSYGPNKLNPWLRIPKLNSAANFNDIFNLCFLTLAFLICIYEAPLDLRHRCLHALKNHLASFPARETAKNLMRTLGSNLEEQWMRSVNLAMTNWIVELQDSNRPIRTPSPLFSYSTSCFGLWKVQLYCPVIAMDVQSSSNPTPDERLGFSLNYHQVEGVIQFNYKVTVLERGVEVTVAIDNLRLDVIKLVNRTLMVERGFGEDEKHFPSRISLTLTPVQQTNVVSVSVSKSSENPTREIGCERTIEASIEPSSTLLGVSVAAGESITMSLKPWKFEESILGNSANLNWYLHDSIDGREVASSKPSKMAMIHPKAWFKNRYSSAYRAFTREGGVVFARDEYGESVRWKMDKRVVGRSMEWEITGRVWLTYWPNKVRTFYNETRRLDFREVVSLNIN